MSHANGSKLSTNRNHIRNNASTGFATYRFRSVNWKNSRPEVSYIFMSKSNTSLPPYFDLVRQSSLYRGGSMVHQECISEEGTLQSLWNHFFYALKDVMGFQTICVRHCKKFPRQVSQASSEASYIIWLSNFASARQCRSRLNKTKPNYAKVCKTTLLKPKQTKLNWAKQREARRCHANLTKLN